MAGNIIPAIATTNAIVSGLIVLQALQLLRIKFGLIGSNGASSSKTSAPSTANPAVSALRCVHLQRKAEVPINACNVGRPLPTCGVCRDTYTEVLCDPSRVTLGEVVDGILGAGEGDGIGPREVSVFEDKRLLAEPEFEDNLGRTLEDMGVRRGMFLTIVDEDDVYANLAVAIGSLPCVFSYSSTSSFSVTLTCALLHLQA
jgi:ubiquitin-like 1-activating enzyme E1 B